MKVLQVYRPVEGGIKRHLEILDQNLPNHNIIPVFCGPQDDMNSLNISDNYQLEITDGLNIQVLANNVYRLRNIVSKVKPDIIHSHGYKASAVVYGLSPFLRIPWISTLHGYKTWGRNITTKRTVFDLMSKQVLQRPQKVLCVSKALQKELHSIGMEEDKCKVVYNGIPISQYHQNVDDIFGGNYHRPNSKLITYIGRMMPDKGLDTFLTAIKILVDKYKSYIDSMNLQFVIAGDGPWRNYYEQMSWEWKIAPYITFLGYRKDISNILKQSYALCIPSRYEGQSITAVEAMASFCPVIASRTGGLQEILSHGETGLLIRRNDPLELAQKIILILKNKHLRRQLIFKAYYKALKNFSDKKMTSEIVETYNEVAKNVRV
ncbi:glycosyltransferase family 4 protein [Natranaerobius thermophilus JW/NM-WN-LF]